MKQINILLLLTILMIFASSCGRRSAPEVVAETAESEEPDVVFNRIDEHTWHGYGHLCYNEALYLVEGEERAILIDAGTKIANLPQIVAGLTEKPVTLIATHVHPDHTGSAVNDFDEIYINAGDMVNVASMMADYPGTIKYLSDGQIIDLGGREIEVMFTPGHTPGSTTFFDKEAGYGFSGDAFGSTNLLLATNFQTLFYTTSRVEEYMEKNNIEFLYSGHSRQETLQRIKDLKRMSREMIDGVYVGEILSGKGNLDCVITDGQVKINFSSKAPVLELN